MLRAKRVVTIFARFIHSEHRPRSQQLLIHAWQYSRRAFESLIYANRSCSRALLTLLGAMPPNSRERTPFPRFTRANAHYLHLFICTDAVQRRRSYSLLTDLNYVGNKFTNSRDAADKIGDYGINSQNIRPFTLSDMPWKSSDSLCVSSSVGIRLFLIGAL